MPQASIDPVVMAAATVLRLQTIVARELAPHDAAVVTIGSLQAGERENIIPDEAVIKLNVRTFDEDVRKRVLAAIARIVNAEAAASGASPPEITPLGSYSLVANVGLLVRRWHRPERIRGGQRGGAARGHSHEPQSGIRSDSASDAGDGRRGHDRRCSGLAGRMRCS